MKLWHFSASALVISLLSPAAFALQPVDLGFTGNQPQPDSVAGQGTWQTTLLPRDFNGDGKVDAYFDTSLNITWASAAVRKDDVALALAFNPLPAYGGVNGWRLPSVYNTTGVCSSLFDSTARPSGRVPGCGYNAPTTTSDGKVTSELAHLWYTTLGNKAYFGANPASQYHEQYVSDGFFGHFSYWAEGQEGWGLTNRGPMLLENRTYWMKSASQGYLVFQAAYGFQGQPYTYSDFQSTYGYAPSQSQQADVLIVHDGDIFAPVPEPTTAMLSLAGLLVIGVCRRKQPEQPN